MGHIVFLGPPGSGKGTQCRLLAGELGYVHLSTGELLRETIGQGTAVGRWIAHRLDDGNFAPDHFVLQMVSEWMANGLDRKKCLLDGFPRTIAQAQEFDRRHTGSVLTIERCVLLTLPLEELTSRLLKRSQLEGRADDKGDAVRHRIRVFQEVTLPLAEYYDSTDRLIRIDGSGEIDVVRQRIVTALRWAN